jgi:hypothetical protein
MQTGVRAAPPPPHRLPPPSLPTQHRQPDEEPCVGGAVALLDHTQMLHSQGPTLFHAGLAGFGASLGLGASFLPPSCVHKHMNMNMQPHRPSYQHAIR